MRTFICFLLCAVGVVSFDIVSNLLKYSVLKKEDLRGLSRRVRDERLTNAVRDVKEEVIRSEMISRIEYKEVICDNNHFLQDSVLKDFSDVEILGRLQSFLVDSNLNITPSYCANCVRNGYKMEPNCRVLLIEW